MLSKVRRSGNGGLFENRTAHYNDAVAEIHAVLQHDAMSSSAFTRCPAAPANPVALFETRW
jgi:hypothetical protein